MLGDGELGARVVVVAFAAAGSLGPWQARLGLSDTLVLSDPQRAAYAAFGFGRASVARVWLDPRVWARYGSLVARGRRPELAEDDTLQLGGDVLADADGVVRWVYESSGPEDRPALDRVRREVEACAR